MKQDKSKTTPLNPVITNKNSLANRRAMTKKPMRKVNVIHDKGFVEPKAKVSEQIIIEDENKPKPPLKTYILEQDPEISYNPVQPDLPEKKIDTTKQMIIAGSNYQRTVPQIGVRIKEDNHTKNGGLNFQESFGKMSLKEYEKIRDYFMGKNNQQVIRLADQRHPQLEDQLKDLYNQQAPIEEESSTLKSQRKKDVVKEGIKKNGIVSHYDWKDFDKNNMDFIINHKLDYDKILEHGTNNEDLFKHRKFSQIRTVNTKKGFTSSINALQSIQENAKEEFLDYNQKEKSKSNNKFTITAHNKNSQEVNLRTRKRKGETMKY